MVREGFMRILKIVDFSFSILSIFRKVFFLMRYHLVISFAKLLVKGSHFPAKVLKCGDSKILTNPKVVEVEELGSYLYLYVILILIQK